VLNAKPVQRLQLCELLWPDIEETLAGKRLTDAVFGLNKDFKTTAGIETPLIMTGNSRETLMLNPQIGIRCDINCFKKLSANSTDIQQHERALSLYQGGFLETFRLNNVSADFDHCIDGVRTEMENRHHQLLKSLSLHYLHDGHYEGALPLLERLYDEYPEDHALKILLMICFSAAGKTPYSMRLPANGTAAVLDPEQLPERVWQMLQQHDLKNQDIEALIGAALSTGQPDPDQQMRGIVRTFLRATGLQRPLQPGADYRRVLQRAEKEARGFGFELIGTVHLWLALSIEQDPYTEGFFEYLRAQIGRNELISLINQIVGEGSSADPGTMQYTLALDALLLQAKYHAEQDDEHEIGVRHLWLALLGQHHSLLRRIMEYYGADYSGCLQRLQQIPR
jgi:hypothetical protein